jgi:hypothetical protein
MSEFEPQLPTSAPEPPPPAAPVPPSAPQSAGRDVVGQPAASWAPPPTLAEAAAVPTITEPVTPAPAYVPRRPASVLRWAVALVVVALLVGVVSAGAILLTGSSSASALEGWIPNGTIMYGEVRGDLPGDQAAKFNAIIGRFPGFKDQANLSAKLDEAFDKALGSSGVSWSRDLKPLISGEMGMAMSAGIFDWAAQHNPAMNGLDGSVPVARTVAATKLTSGLVAVIGLKDAAATSTYLKAHGSGTTLSQYAGGDLYAGDSQGATFAWAIRENVLFFGLIDNVKAAIDTKGSGELAKSANFLAAKKIAKDPYLAFMWMDGKGFWDGYMKVLAAMPYSGMSSTGAASCMFAKMTDMMPAWSGGVVQARDGAIYFGGQSAAANLPFTYKDSVSTIAPRLPADTVVSMDIRDAGALYTQEWDWLTQIYACDANTKKSLDMVGTALATVGGIKGAVGWAGDTSIAVTRDGAAWGGGLATVAADPAGAKAMFIEIQNLLAAAGAAGASGYFTTNLSDYAGGKLLSLTFPESTGSYLMSSVPPLAMGLRDDLFVLGTADFVKATFDTKAGAGLAAQPRYQKAIGMAGASAATEVYIDITSVREGAEAVAAQYDSAAMSHYTTDVKPFLEPFDSVIMTSNAPANGTQSSGAYLIFK